MQKLTVRDSKRGASLRRAAAAALAREAEAAGACSARSPNIARRSGRTASRCSTLPPVDVAFKVVGTGSVGTRNYVVLCFGNGVEDPLMLQVKQALPSSYARPLRIDGDAPHEGKRVAEGQHRMQTVADPFLGWTTLDGHHYLVRQLSDHKASIDPADLRARRSSSTRWCAARSSRRAHARAGDAAVMYGYCGDAEKLDRAIATFSVAYADQASADYDEFKKAIRSGQSRQSWSR